MKYLELLLLSLFLTPCLLKADNKGLDTIFCDTKNTSYMIFLEDVTLCDVGYVDDYAAQVRGNIVFVKALKENAPATTLLIKSGKEIYFGMLKFKEKNQKYYYDFKNPAVVSAGSTSIKDSIRTTKIIKAEEPNPAKANESKVVSSDPLLKEKMLEFIKIKNELSTLGFISSSLDVALTVIRNDNNNTFLKIILKNKSSIPYKLDFISFQYYQDMKKGAIRKAKKAPMDVFPVGEPGIKEIAGGKTELLPYVIPSYALSNEGYLMLLVRESSGDRVLKIKVNGSLIQDSPQLITNGN